MLLLKLASTIMATKEEASGLLASGFIPKEPEEITAEWLHQVIAQYRQSKSLSPIKDPDDLVECEISERKASMGYLSSTYTIDVHFKCYSDQGMEQCGLVFFLKMLPSEAIQNGDRNRKLARDLRVFENEVRTMFHLLPMVQKSKSVQMCLPQIVYGSHDVDGNGVIVLIDEAQNCYRPITSTIGLSFDETQEVICRLAEMHAASTACLVQNDPEDFRLLEERTTQQAEAARDELLTVFRDYARFLKRIPGYIEMHRRFEKHRVALSATLVRSFRKPSQFPLKTLIHGELCASNLLFRRVKRGLKPLTRAPVRQGSLEFADVDEDEEGVANGQSDTVDIDVLFCDWKFATVSSPTVDLVMLLLSSTNQAARLKHTKQWLEQYYFCFTECLRTKFHMKLSKSYPEFDYDVFYQDYNDNLFTGYLQAVSLIVRELKFLEIEFNGAKDAKEKLVIGESLRYLGRRLLELTDELGPLLGKQAKSEESNNNNNVVVQESVSATIKLKH